MLDAMFAAGGLGVLQQNWQTIQYDAEYPTGPVEISACVEPLSSGPAENPAGGVDHVHKVRLTVLQSLGAKAGDMAYLSSVGYRVTRIVGQTANYTVLEAERQVSHEQTRKAFRGSR